MREFIAFLILVVVGVVVVYLSRLALRLARGDGATDDGDADGTGKADPCPDCGYDLRGGHRRCPECGLDVTPEAMVARGQAGEFDGIKLSSDWPADSIVPVQPGDGELLADAFSTQNGWVAPLLQEQLMARGVWCRLEEIDRRVLRGSISVSTTTYTLLVAEHERDRALTIISRFRRAASSRPGLMAAAEDDS